MFVLAKRALNIHLCLASILQILEPFYSSLGRREGRLGSCHFPGLPEPAVLAVCGQLGLTRASANHP